jgi:hypothetical protein
MNSMQPSNGFAFLDGNSIIKMNNLAVGYFPTQEPEIGVYPPPHVPAHPTPEPTGAGQLMLAPITVAAVQL